MSLLYYINDDDLNGCHLEALFSFFMAYAAVPANKPINLKKGQAISLTKKINLEKKELSIDNLHVGLGWDVSARGGVDFDLDALAYCQKQDGSWDTSYACNYSQLDTPNGALHHCGDNLTGEGEGDDEVIEVKVSKLPPHIVLVRFQVSIYDAVKRKQHFGKVQNAFIRLVNMDTHEELCRYTLSDDEFSGYTKVLMGIVRRTANNDWEFVAEGKGISKK